MEARNQETASSAHTATARRVLPLVISSEEIEHQGIGDMPELIVTDLCAVDGCDRPRKRIRNRGRYALCSGHLARKQRQGDVLAHIPLISHASAGSGTIDADGYTRDHLSSGYVYRHVLILQSAIGPGPHLCHWCGTWIDWQAPRPHELQVDHLDGDKQHNTASNLVPSCNSCNTRRGQAGNPTDWVATL